MANQVELTCNVRLFVPTLFCSISPTFHTSQIGTQMLLCRRRMLGRRRLGRSRLTRYRLLRR